MPRPNPHRRLANERNLARRIEMERRQRDLSYEALAALMTDAGCPIQGSAIYKIEKSDPPRRITVDELVALSTVFETSIEDLLRPVEVLEKERALELVKELNETLEDLPRWLFRTFAAYLDLMALQIDDPDLAEFVEGHHDAFLDGDSRGLPVVIEGDVDPEVRALYFRLLLPAAQAIMQVLLDAAASMATHYHGVAPVAAGEKRLKAWEQFVAKLGKPEARNGEH